MNIMKTSSGYMLAIIVLMHCFRCIGSYKNSVQLYPSPSAEVGEGETLCLHCSHPVSAPHFINWYLNNDTYGLVINTNECLYQAIPKLYETDRYKISCNKTICYLSIANISKSKDDGAIWRCDITVIGMNRSNEALTRIVVKATDTKDDMGQRGVEPNIVAAFIVGAIIAIIAVAAVLTLCKYRKRKPDGMINKRYLERTLSKQQDVYGLEKLK
ncbi:hypothetical protein CHS0354_020812 [Potamilus streckersoni]|uniref:Ig-like domain-containing protein n=1 Tax=Potamilus streckersoni TaxID=2493646 RepID=A0AAE0VN70_9BIVA|nr:hypothetical protein CHS0354_020812 [Potamilus streckersoni]